ncbi:MAG TPA: HemK family protein methyltransferase [Acidimicrobiales bacterium]|nr:HemK family protein methyltransferase [Acidimicrobiales bacterium]
MNLVARLGAAGCIAADEEAGMLTEAAGGDLDRLESLVRRREAGEPVEWIVGWAPFCGLRVVVQRGVYVPRAQTEVLARRALEVLPARGLAVDLATGSGAVAVVLAVAGAEVVATEIDPVAAACARANGVTVFEGDLDGPLPATLEGRVDVLTANVPYVPTHALSLLPRDVQDHEPRLALDGGTGGLDHVRRVLALASRWLRPATGRVLVEIGPDQAAAFPGLVHHRDEDGDVRAVEAGAGTAG